MRGGKNVAEASEWRPISAHQPRQENCKFPTNSPLWTPIDRRRIGPSTGTPRDEYAASLNSQTEFKLTGHLDMHNAILDDPKVTTGDHDGKAVVLCSGG
jgi:hypothetical protein